MAISITFNRGCYIIDTGGPILRYPLASTELTTNGDDVIIAPVSSDSRRSKVVRGHYSDFTSPSGSSAEEVAQGIQDLNAGVDINIQDQTTDAVIIHFNKVSNSTTLSVAAEIDDGLNYTITVVDDTGVVAGSMIILFHPASERFSTAHALSTTNNVITLDRPIDFDYPIGTFVDIASVDLAVDGSSTRQVFGLRGTGAPPGVDISFDMTRIILVCTCENAVNMSTFGDIIGGLTNGLVLRTRNDRYHNIFNIKTNLDISNIMYDFDFFDSTKQEAVYGFKGRLTFAGTSKIGVAIRLPIGTDAEFLVQDNLSGLTSLKVFAEGHIVEGPQD